MNVPLPLIVVLLVNSWKECIAQSLYEMIGVNLFLQIAAGEFARRQITRLFFRRTVYAPLGRYWRREETYVFFRYLELEFARACNRFRAVSSFSCSVISKSSSAAKIRANKGSS
jgi:hypothetical protein